MKKKEKNKNLKNKRRRVQLQWLRKMEVNLSALRRRHQLSRIQLLKQLVLRRLSRIQSRLMKRRYSRQSSMMRIHIMMKMLKILFQMRSPRWLRLKQGSHRNHQKMPLRPQLLNLKWRGRKLSRRRKNLWKISITKPQHMSLITKRRRKNLMTLSQEWRNLQKNKEQSRLAQAPPSKPNSSSLRSPLTLPFKSSPKMN